MKEFYWECPTCKEWNACTEEEKEYDKLLICDNCGMGNYVTEIDFEEKYI